MRRWHGGSVLAAVALTRGGNVTIPVDGGPRPALALVDGDDVCAAVRAYCDGTPFKSTGLLKDASWSATTGDGVGLPGADGCVRALAEAVQPRLERDWPATRARFAVRDDYLAGCVAADFGLDAEGPDDPLFALLAEAVAARDAASPALAEYNRRRTLLPPARRARHYRDVCLKLLPAHPGALDSLAVALRHAGRARAAELVRDGADLNRWSRAPVPDSISAQVLARGAGRGLWPSPYQRPAHHAANLTARPLWAAGARLLSACEHWCAAEYSCSGESCGDCPGCTPPANASMEAVNTTLAACPIEPPADRAAARVGCILIAALAGFIVVVALVWRPSRKGCSGERVSRWATLLSSSLLVCGSSLLIVFLSSPCGDPNFFYAGISCCAAGLAIATASRSRRSAAVKSASAARSSTTLTRSSRL